MQWRTFIPLDPVMHKFLGNSGLHISVSSCATQFCGIIVQFSKRSHRARFSTECCKTETKVIIVTRVLHTIRISNVVSTVCDNEERKMVNFKLGKKLERWNIQFVTRVGQRKNLSPRW